MPRFLRFLLPLIALILACGGFTGCATVPQADAFDVTLVNLSPANATLFESQVVVTLRYTNGTNTPLSLSGSRHKIFLNGRAVGIAVSAEATTIEGLSTITQDLTLNLNNLSLIGLIREVQTNPSVRYEIDSTLYLGRSSRNARAMHDGTIDLRAFAQASSLK
jgi:LEA14-like dessication related protein